MRKTPLREQQSDFGVVGILAPARPEIPNPHRHLLDGELETPLTEHEWRWLLDSDLYRRFQRREVDVRAVVVHIEQTRAAFGKQTRLRGELPPRAADESLAAILASIAAKVEPVTKFRSEHLSGGLLNTEAVKDWIDSHSCDPTNYIVVQVDSSFWGKVRNDWRAPRAALNLSDPFLVSPAVPTRLLAYRSKGEIRNAILHFSESPKGLVLWALLWAAQSLQEAFSWKQADAVHFILTGTAPPPTPSISFRASQNPTYPVLSRLTIEVNPEVNPKELAAFYRNVRRQHFKARTRSMTEKHITLARFYTMSERTVKWKNLMAQWNKTAEPAWRYRSESNFERDCKEAVRRILGTARSK